MLAAVFAVAVLAVLFAAPRQAQAASITSCTVSSSGLTFPNYDLIGQAQDAGTGTLVVQCTGKGTSTVTVGLSTGSGSCTTRTVKLSSSLNYNIYTTSALGTVWCDPTTRVSVTFALPNGQGGTLSQNVTMYGAVDASQSVAPGTYTDTLQATVYWAGGNSPASNVAIQVTAPATCAASAGALGFGNYTGVVVQAQATLTTTCSLSTPYTIALAGGSNLNGVQRQMSDGLSHYIPYFLYSNSSRTTSWGDGTALGATVAGTGTGVAQSLTVYGSTGAQSALPPGNYSDSVVMTVSY
jgi:spore coat protein U-like protein